MAKVIQVRGVPDDVHAKLVAAAATAGKSLTEFVKDELAHVVRSLDPVEHNRRVLAKLRSEIGVIDLGAVDTVRLLEEMREERTNELIKRTLSRPAP